MPPKRKLKQDTQAENAPPAKRTRSHGPPQPSRSPSPEPPAPVTRTRRKTKAETQAAQREAKGPVEHSTAPVRKYGRKRATRAPLKARSTQVEVTNEPEPESKPVPEKDASPPPASEPKRRGRKKRPPGIPAKLMTPADETSSVAREPTPVPPTTAEEDPDSRVFDADPDDSPLVKLDKLPSRAVTPLARNKHAFGTPHYIVEVVVATPSRKLRTPSRAANARPLAPVPPSPTAVSSKPEQLKEKSTSKLASPPPKEQASKSGSHVATKPSTSPPREDTVAPPRSPSKPTVSINPLQAQQRAALAALRRIDLLDAEDGAEDDEDAQPTSNELAFDQLCELLRGTVDRGEGNSCFLTGPRGSGKTYLVEKAISKMAEPPIVVRLSGHVQTNDRLAIREIARQLAEQTGKSLLPAEDGADGDDDENPFLDESRKDTVIALPPPSHLLALISVIPTLARPTVLIIDAIDLFALHARQSLLYCLLDTAQSCRAGGGTKGIAVVGITTRIDTINMLEKRVKSRFSGRMLRTACPSQLEQWMRKAQGALCGRAKSVSDEWHEKWRASVEAFFDDEAVRNAFKETFALSRDTRLLSRLLIPLVAGLKQGSPSLSVAALQKSVSSQRQPSRYAFLATLAYPSLCLLIAAMHARTSGHETFTFEMLHEAFRDQVRASQSAPVQIEGGGIGMVRCDREVLMGACEQLVALRVFVGVTAPSGRTKHEFIRYRCAVDRADVKTVVEQTGQLNLRKWFSKS